MEKNERLVRRIYDDVFNESRHELVDELYHRDLVAHDPAYPPIHGTGPLKELLVAYRAAMPDHRYTLEDLIAAGDRVVVRWSMTGTHEGPLMHLKPTGAVLKTSGISILRLESGKVAEVWQQWDNVGFYKQLGVSPLTLG